MERLKIRFILFMFFISATMLALAVHYQPTASAQDYDHQVWLPMTAAIRNASFTYEINEALQPSVPELPAIPGGGPRPVGVAVDPAGGRDEFVSNEIVVKAGSAADLAPLLARYNGQILRDGTPFVPPGETAEPGADLSSSGWYLVQVDPQTSPLDDFAPNMEQAGADGAFTFSSEETARLLALAARESNVDINPLMHDSGQYDDDPDKAPVENWWWMTEDDDPDTPAEEGLSVGVIHAWEYLRYHHLPPSSGSWSPPRIAIIDGGFALDETTGYPTGGNIDYFPSRPWQADLIDHDGTAGGQNLLTCGGSPCPWHGTSVFGVALARHSNQYGGAGTSGNAAWAMLLRVDSSYFSAADAIRSAAINGADVINLSLGGFCNSVCRTFTSFDNALQNAVDFAITGKAVVLAAAGNSGTSLDGTFFMPCEIDHVICVGSVNRNGNNVFNFGSKVDIWAPTNVFSTITPASPNLQTFGGTSASTPFVSGIVGLMKALDPNIVWSDVQDILQDTANAGSDPTVSLQYVDAYRAVKAVRFNEPPTVSITYPADNATISYNPLSFRATAVDAERGDPEDYPDSGRVEWRSDVDGLLCTVEGFYWAGLSFGCDVGNLSLGQHTITATAIDDHGASAQDQVTITAVNHPPTAEITRPADNATFYNHQNVELWVTARDQDGPHEIEWRSDLDGFLGDEWRVKRQFSTGTHRITVEVTDELGEVAEDSITLNIIPGDGVPTITILEPTNSSHFPDTPIDFRAEVTDPEDGELDGQSVRWYSNRDGFLGAGQVITAPLSGPATACNPEFVRHTITVVAVDSDGHEIQEQFNLSVGVLC